MSAQETDEVKVFHTALIWRILSIPFVLAGIFLLTSAVGLACSSLADPIQLCVSIFLVGWSIIVLLSVVELFRRHLVISPKGIEYHIFGRSTYAEWDDVEQIGPWGIYKECVILGSWRNRANRLMSWLSEAMGDSHIIPLALYSGRLWEKDVVSEILRYTARPKTKE
jgi:hypothetical protein